MALLFNSPSALLYRRLLKTYVWRYRRALIIGAACMVITAAASASQAYLMQPVLDDIFVNKNTTYLMLLPLLLIVIALVAAASDYGQSLSMIYVGQRAVSDMQGDLFEHLMHADISLFHDQSSGRLISRMTNDIMMMRQSVSQVIVGLIKECLTAIFLLGVMLCIVAVQMLSVGLLGEATTRLYYSRDSRRPFTVRRVLNGFERTVRHNADMDEEDSDRFPAVIERRRAA